MRYRLLLLTALNAALLAGCRPLGTGRSAEAPRILAAGNTNNLYVLVTAPVDGAEGFRYWQRDAAGLWHAGEAARGTPAAVAAWREHLLVLFPSGRWGRFGLDRPSVHPSPVPAWTPIAACDDGLAADAFGTMATGDAALLRYEASAWSTDPEMVPGVERDRVLDPCLARSGGRLFLVWREEVQDFPGSGAPYQLRFAIRAADGAWQRPLSSRLRVASPAHVAARDQDMICLYRKPAADGPSAAWFLATYATADEDWHEAGPVGGTEGLESLSLAAACGDFIVALVSGDRPAVARLDVAARTLGAPTTVPDEGAAAEREEPVSWLALMMLGGMAAVLTLLALRGRRPQPEATQNGAATDAGHPAAPMWRRGLAVAVDYILVVFVASAIVATLAPSASEAMERIWDQVRTGRQDDVDVASVLIFQGIRLFVIFAYFTLAEGLTGRTPGKALLGIEVRTVHGEPIGLRRAVVRNLLRPVDELPALYVLGLILVIRGPRPQRLGDRVAGTLVVRTAPPAGA